MIRVLHVIGKMDCGGAETLLMNLYRSIDREKIQFDFMVHSSEHGFYDEEIKALGGKIYYAPKFNVINFFQYKHFWANFLRCDFEHQIIHGHICSSAAIYLSVAKKYGKKTVVHSHNTKSIEKNIHTLAFNIFSYPIRYIAEYFFGCSKQAGIDRFGRRIAESSRFKVLNNGIDVEKYIFNDLIRRKIRKDLLNNNDTVVIGHVGRFSAQKNHEFLLKVFSAYHQSNPKSELWLIGKGELEEKIKQLTQLLGIKDCVRFLGITDCVQDYLCAMDIFVFPSIYEGLGIAVVEAQTCGLPCIVSDSIVDEADIHAGLIKKLRLDESFDNWIESINQFRDFKRTDRSQNAIDSGFDIVTISNSLTIFYENIIK